MVEFKFICATVKSRYIRDGHPTCSRVVGNPYNGYINPYYWVDDHPLLYGNSWNLDPGTYGVFLFCILFPSLEEMSISGNCALTNAQIWQKKQRYQVHVICTYLVRGFNPFEKYYSSQIGSFPQVGGKINNI